MLLAVLTGSIDCMLQKGLTAAGMCCLRANAADDDKEAILAALEAAASPTTASVTADYSHATHETQRYLFQPCGTQETIALPSYSHLFKM
jgi:hypothetical protein